MTYSAVLHHEPFVRHEQFLQREDHSPQIRLVLVMIQLPLSVQDIMHGYHVVLQEEDNIVHEDITLPAVTEWQSA